MSDPSFADHRAQDGDQQDDRAGFTARFLLAVGEEVRDAGLQPEALARACATVLSVDGAGLSTMVSILRQPLAATSDDCRRSEELQSTLDEGPCLHAAEAQAAIVADLSELGERWPLYTEELTRRTPFRAVASVPLRAPARGVFAALDLYSTDPHLSKRLRRHEVDVVGEMTGALLAACLAQITDIDSPDAGPEWFRAAAGRRHEVWVAIGMVMGGRGIRTRDALSLLRAHAYTHSRSLDDLAGALARGDVPLADLTD